ncbi:hypothetical protein I4U23_023664 [Adineta vaga]|nr:hypothetical protein I4U23_023664 [Adineta vaga]
MSNNPPCIKCELTGNSNGLFTCNGCRQSFCSNHIEDHSTERRHRFENLTDEYNSIYDRFLEYKQISKYYQWRGIEKKLYKIKSEFDQQENLFNFCNRNLDDWNNQLNEINIHLTRPIESTSVRLSNVKRYGIYFSCILLLVLLYYWNDSILLKRLFTTRKFIIIKGPILLHENGHVAEHKGYDDIPGRFIVNQNYSKNINFVRFIVEKFSSSNSFIGIVESEYSKTQTPIYGWFIGDGRVKHLQPVQSIFIHLLQKIWSFFIGNQEKHHDVREIKQGDTIEIKIDCIQSKLTLKNLRTKTSEDLDIQQKRTPLPWQIWISLDRHEDRIRLL